MNNLKSYTEYAVSTPTVDFVIGFDFNYGTDAVNVTVDDVPATEAGYSVIYLNSTTIRLNPAVPTGVVRLQRETDIDIPDNQFTAGAKFIASNMDENFTQLRHAQQEVRDGFGKLSEDTYEIIDTLQEVGQAAQDAADAAEQAAQTANDAAAQVNDKVSYQDLDNAVEVAVAPVKDYVALPFKTGKSYALYERVQLTNGAIVKNTVAGNTVDPNVSMAGWVKTNDASQIFDSRGLNQQEINNLQNTPLFYGAIADGTLHTVNEWTVIGVNRFYPNLAAIQAHYPHVTSLTDSIDWAATVKAMSVKNQVFFGDNSKHYVFNKTAFTNHNQKLFGDGATIRQTKAQTQLFDPSGKTNFVMMGLRLAGMGAADFTNSSGSRSDGVYASAAMGIHIEQCQFEALSHSSLTCTQSSNIKFINNTVLGLGSSVLTPTTSHSNCGVVIDKSCVNAVVSGNTLTGMAMGIITGNLCVNLRFIDNYIEDITGQHGIYINAAQTNVHISGNQIGRTSLAGIKVQTYDVEAKETTGVVVCGNNIMDVGTDGIVVDNTSTTPIYLTVDISIFGNTIKNAGQDGVNARYIKRGLISGNIIDNVNREGISYGGCVDVVLDNNLIDGVGNNGIREAIASNGCSIRKNKIKNPAINGISNSRYGIFIGAASTDLTLSENEIVDTQSKMRYGIYIETGNQTSFTIKGNVSKGASDYGFRTAVAGQAFKYFGDNIFEGTLGSTLGLDSIPLQRGNTGRAFFGNAMPTSGTFSKGDYVSNINPSITGGVVILGWYRVTNGAGHVLNTDWVAVKQSTA